MTLSFACGGGAWKDDPEFSEFAELSVNLNQSGVLLDNDVEAQRKPETGAFARRFGSEEWVEHLLPHLGRNARAVIANSDFDAVTEVSGRGGKRRLITIDAIFGLAFHCRIEIRLSSTRVISSGSSSASPAAGSKSCSSLI